MQLLARVVAVLTACAALARAADPGQPAPDLGKLDLIGAPAGASVEADALKGRVVVVDFWATWCAPCIAAIPHLNELADEFGPQGVIFVSVTDEPRAKVEPFLARKPIKGWVAVGSPRYYDAWGVEGIPEAFVIGRDGRVLGKDHPEKLAADDLRAALKGEPIAFGNAAPTTAPTTAPAARRVTGHYDAGQFPGEGGDPLPLYRVEVRATWEAPDDDNRMGATYTRGNATYTDHTAAQLCTSVFGYDRIVVTDAAQAALAARGRQLYDAAAAVPRGADGSALLRDAVARALGVEARQEPREVDALVLTATPDAQAKLVPTVSTGGSSSRSKADPKAGRMELSCVNATAGGLRYTLERWLGRPVFDESGLGEQGYDFDLTLPSDPAAASAALEERLGLKLVPTRREVAFTVVDAKPTTRPAK